MVPHSIGFFSMYSEIYVAADIEDATTLKTIVLVTVYNHSRGWHLEWWQLYHAASVDHAFALDQSFILTLVVIHKKNGSFNYLNQIKSMNL